MDSILNAAALALSRGDLLGALNRVALREDPPALALRGIAMAQLGELMRARELLRLAATGFGKDESVARARCILAEAEIALVSRDLMWPAEHLEAARRVLDSRGDKANAAHACITGARRHLLLGHLDLAEQELRELDGVTLPAALVASRDLVLAGIHVRRLQPAAAREALMRAGVAAHQSGLSGLIAEVGAAQQALQAPVAQLREGGKERPISLGELERLLLSEVLLVDGTRDGLRQGGTVISLSTRPVLFALIRTLAAAWPDGASREMLLAGAFGARHADESHRARLRVEIARLRKVIEPLAEISATSDGFRLISKRGSVAILAIPLDGQGAAIMALLADGELWSSSALSLVLGSSTRTVQRALEKLQRSGKAQAMGRGRAQRWTTLAFPGFPTTLLLPGGR